MTLNILKEILCESNSSSASPFTPLDEKKTFRSKLKMNLHFRKVSKKSLTRLLNRIDSYVDNPRYNRKQFEKYMYSTKGIDSVSNSMYYGLFDSDGRCLALSYLNKVPKEHNFILIAEIQSIIRGYGKILIENLLSTCDNIWWAADPEAKKTLIDYYRQFKRFGVKEKTLVESKFSKNGKDETFFFKCSDDRHERVIRDYIDSFRVKRMSFPRSEWPELKKRVEEGKRIVTHRVSSDADRFDIGDLVKAELGTGKGSVLMDVVNKKVVRTVSDSPYLRNLTDRQRSFLSKFRKIAVLTLEPVVDDDDEND